MSNTTRERIGLSWTVICIIGAIFSVSGAYFSLDGKVTDNCVSISKHEIKIDTLDERLRLQELANERAASDLRYIIQQIEKVNIKLDSWESQERAEKK